MSTEAMSDPLPPHALLRLGNNAFRTGAPVFQLAFALGGKAIVTSCNDTLQLWDVPSGKLGRTIQQERYLSCFALTPDGRTVAAGEMDTGNVNLLDLLTGAELHRIHAHRSPVVRAAFTGDGAKLVTGAGGDVRGRTLRVWDVATGKRAHTFMWWDAVYALAVSPTQELIAVANNTHVLLFSFTQETPQVWLEGHAGGTNALAFSADGRYLLSGGEDFCIALWDVHKGEAVRAFEGHDEAVLALAWHPTKPRQFLSAGRDRTVQHWDAAKEERTAWLNDLPAEVSAVAYAPDGKLMAWGGDDYRVHLFDLNQETELTPGGGHGDSILSVRYAPDGKLLATASMDGTARLWDAATGAERHVLKHGELVCCLAFSRDGVVLATGGEGARLRLWDVASGAENQQFRADDDDGVNCLAVSANGKWLASGGYDGKVRVWEAEAPKKPRFFRGHRGSIEALVFTPDGRLLISAASTYEKPDDTIRFWEFSNGRMLHKIDNAYEPASLAVSPDGKLLAWTDADPSSEIKLFNIASMYAERKIAGHEGYVMCVAFSPDGRWLASASMDGTARIWDVATRGELAKFSGHMGGLHAVAFSPDGQRLASVGDDATCLVWNLTEIAAS